MTQANTPFEKAGYTRDSKFRVTIRECDFKEGDVVILRKDDGTHSPQFMLVNDPDVWDYMNLGEEVELIVEQEVSNASYPNPPYKHAAIIVEWVKGAEIEYYDKNFKLWVSARTPTWSENLEYRVKPQKSEKDIQIEKLEAELEELETSVSKAWLDYNTSVLNLLQCRQELQEIKSNAQ